jgi:hypothetical protein
LPQVAGLREYVGRPSGAVAPADKPEPTECCEPAGARWHSLRAAKHGAIATVPARYPLLPSVGEGRSTGMAWAFASTPSNHAAELEPIGPEVEPTFVAEQPCAGIAHPHAQLPTSTHPGSKLASKADSRMLDRGSRPSLRAVSRAIENTWDRSASKSPVRHHHSLAIEICVPCAGASELD